MRTLLIISVICLLSACKKEPLQQASELPVIKKIEFHLHARRDYSGPEYDGITAEVKLAIYKINYRNGDAQKIWDSTFTNRALQQYPVLPGKHAMEKMIPVLESREKIQANYNIIYRQEGKIWQQGAADECIPGQQFLFLDVGI